MEFTTRSSRSAQIALFSASILQHRSLISFPPNIAQSQGIWHHLGEISQGKVEETILLVLTENMLALNTHSSFTYMVPDPNSLTNHTARLCETLPKTDGYDFTRLDKQLYGTTD